MKHFCFELRAKVSFLAGVKVSEAFGSAREFQAASQLFTVRTQSSVCSARLFCWHWTHSSLFRTLVVQRRNDLLHRFNGSLLVRRALCDLATCLKVGRFTASCRRVIGFLLVSAAAFGRSVVNGDDSADFGRSMVAPDGAAGCGRSEVNPTMLFGRFVIIPDSAAGVGRFGLHTDRTAAFGRLVVDYEVPFRTIRD